MADKNQELIFLLLGALIIILSIVGMMLPEQTTITSFPYSGLTGIPQTFPYGNLTDVPSISSADLWDGCSVLLNNITSKNTIYPNFKDTGLSFQMNASTVYTFEVIGIYSVDNTAQVLQISINGTANPNYVTARYLITTSLSANQNAREINAYNTNNGATSPTTANYHYSFSMTGQVYNGLNAGKFNIVFCDANVNYNVTIVKGALLFWKEIN
jgi:hypothetical protein